MTRRGRRPRPVPEPFREAGYFTCIGDGLPDDEAAGDARRQARGKTDYNFEWNPAMYDAEDWAGRPASRSACR